MPEVFSTKDHALLCSALRVAAKQYAVDAGAAYKTKKGTAEGDAAMNSRADCLALVARIEQQAK